MPTPDFSSVTPQFPFNAAGVLGQNLISAPGRLFIASGGMPAVGPIIGPTGISTGAKNNAVAGWPGIGATLVGTGRYNIMHPPATIVTVRGDVSTPSGVIPHTIKQVRNLPSGTTNPATGITQIEVWATPPGGTQLVNPPTGARFDLELRAFPNNTQGLTQF